MKIERNLFETHSISPLDIIEPVAKGTTPELSDADKIALIENHFREIMKVLGLDLGNDSLKNTPARVAKMYVTEAFSGLNPANKPGLTLFKNTYRYQEMLVEKNITLFSYCEHHFVPIIGKVHVGYISNGYVIGLSKINRLVQYYGRRPQVQERLTQQIAKGMSEAVQSPDVVVLVDAQHLCVASRGVRDTQSNTITVSRLGRFEDPQTYASFLSLIQLNSKP